MATQPSHDQKIDPLCSISLRATLMTGYLKQRLIYHFSKAEQIEEPILRTKLWSAMDTETGLAILTETEWSPDLTEFRPGIVISRNDLKTLQAGINNQMMGETWDATGREHYSSYTEGSSTMFCISSVPREAEILGAEVYIDMMRFSSHIRQDMRLQRFFAAGMGKLFKIKEARDNYAVPVTVAYAAEEKWEIQPFAPYLKTLQMTAFLP